jgi:putative N6-adenine-specific DNA methylase
MIEGSIRSRVFTNSNYAKLKAKDAIVDCFRDRIGKRPDVETEHPDLYVYIIVQENTARVHINLTGTPLFKRGYRETGHPATLNENIAAALVYLSGWNGRETLLDPFCGSGTILIEAAQMQSRVPAGGQRAFSLQEHKFFDKAVWEQAYNSAMEGIDTPNKVNIYGSDHSERFIEIAKDQTLNAGLKNIKFKVTDFEQVSPPSPEGMIISNLPYGERLQEQNELEALYARLGTHLKQNFKGWTAWFLSSETSLLKKLGMSPSEKHFLMNGGLEVRFQKYEIY